MFKSIAVLSAVVATAYAQANPLIPSGIGATCKSFLEELNKDTSIADCTAALNEALSSFAPGQAGAAAADVTGALTNVCSVATTNSCPTAAINAQITKFGTACQDELKVNPNADVVRLYDVFYTIIPMKQALCSKGDDGNWCVSSGVPLAGSASEIQKSLYTESGQTVIPNTAAFAANNLPFLLTSGDLEKDQLCTACTRNILSAYMNYESDVPYGVGLDKSQLLGNQIPLFKAVQEKCGANFMDNAVKAAGGLGTTGGFSFGAAAALAPSALFATAAGLASLVVAVL